MKKTLTIKDEVIDCLVNAIAYCRKNNITFSRDTYRNVAKILDLKYKSDATAKSECGSWDAAVNEAYGKLKPVIVHDDEDEYSFLKKRLLPNNKRYKVLVIPDVHFPFEHKKALDCVKQVAGEYGPDEIIQLGDLIDCYKISRFIKDPARGANVQEELDMAHVFLNEIKSKYCSAKKATFIEGNHEARISKYVHLNASGLSCLRSIGIASLLDLKAIGWDYIQDHEFYGINNVHFTHGEFANKFTSATHMERYGVSIIHGHTHKLQSHCTKFMDRQIEGWEMGCLSSLNVSRDYVKCANWQHGFGTVDIYGEEYWIQGYHIREGKVNFHGKMIEGKK